MDHQTISFYRGKLPHWEVAGGTYFVTIRLWGTLPAHVEKKLRLLYNQYRVAKDIHKFQLQDQIDGCSEKWLNALGNACPLAEKPIAAIVEKAIEHCALNRIWQVYEYVIMPNHVHLLIGILDGSLRSSLMNFKKWTGREAQQMLKLQGQFWQDEWFDHWVRSEQEFWGKVEYIRQNPVIAGLVEKHADWPYGSWASSSTKVE